MNDILDIRNERRSDESFDDYKKRRLQVNAIIKHKLRKMTPVKGYISDGTVPINYTVTLPNGKQEKRVMIHPGTLRKVKE